MDYFYLISGILLLVLSGNWLVKSGSSIAEYFKIPPFIVGITIVSFGTSAPELFVSVNAVLSGSPDIAIGNVVGSNIANLGLVLSFTAIIVNIPIKKSTIRIDYPVLLVSTGAFIFFMSDLLITRVEGGILLTMIFAYILFLILSIRRNKKKHPTETVVRTSKQHPAVSILIVLASCGGLLLGSTFLVDGASNIASNLGVSERVISITVIAFGTSVPELATSIIAAFKKQIDISVGNIIGSNIFNILVITGISSVVKPLSVNPFTMSFDIYFLIGFVVLLGLFFIPFKNAQVNRWKGFVMLTAYFAYYIILFGN